MRRNRERITDQDITLAVETDLIISDAVSDHRIDVSTVDGVAELSGSVSSYGELLSAMQEAYQGGATGVSVSELNIASPGS